MRRVLAGHTAVVVAFLCGAVIATAATAGAAKLITGKEIKNGSIARKDLSKALRKQLSRRGPQGAQGAQGIQGPKGDTGATGPADGPAGGALTGTYPNPGLAAPEAVHLIDLNGNNFLGGGHEEPRYFRDLSGVVHLTGVLSAKVGGYGAGTTWVTLPEGYRPEADFVINGYSNPARLTVVKPTGGVTSYTSANQGDFLGLDGVAFRCAPSGVAGCP